MTLDLDAIRERADKFVKRGHAGSDLALAKVIALDVLALVGRIQELEAELERSVEKGQNVVDGIGMEREMRRDAEARAVKAEAERDTLREALERISDLYETDGADIARAALTQGAGE